MSIPNSRETLKLWCLRKIGHPVIKINADDDQLEDRIDEALEFFQEYHFDATERTYLKHTVTQTDIDNGYITVDDSITGISRIFPFDNTAYSSSNIFNAQYQFRLNDLYNVTSVSVVHYALTMRHMALLDNMFTTVPSIEYNRNQNRVYINDWAEISVGQILVFEVFKVIDPTEFTKVYGDLFLRRYTTALFRLQWADNLRKFTGVKLPGDVEVNGEAMYNEAKEELAKLEEEMETKYMEPVDFFIG